MTIRLVAIALLLGSSAAYAFDSTKVGQWGSLYLDDLLPVLAESAQLASPRHNRYLIILDPLKSSD